MTEVRGFGVLVVLHRLLRETDRNDDATHGDSTFGQGGVFGAGD